MLCALFLKNEHEVKHGRSYLMVERGFDALVRGYERGLDFVLRHQKTTLLVFSRHDCGQRRCSTCSSRRVLPAAGHRASSPASRMPRRTCRTTKMLGFQHKLTDVIAKDPDVAGWGAFVGGQRPFSNSFAVIGLKPRDERTVDGGSGHRSPAQRVRESAGRESVPAAGAGHQPRRPRDAHSVSVHAAGSESGGAEHLGAQAAREAQDLARAARREHRRADEQPRSFRSTSIATRRRGSAFSRR